MFTPAATLALLLASVGGPPSLQPRATAEVVLRARSDGLLTRTEPGALLELRPSARLLMKAQQLTLTSTYRPRLFAGLLNADPLAGIQHAAEVIADWDAARGRRFRLTQRGAYGFEDYGYIEAGSRSWSMDIRPPSARHYAALQSEVSATLQATRAINASVAVGFSLSGSLDRLEQNQVPLQRGPYLSATGSYQLSRRDLLMTQVWSSYAFSTGRRRSGVLRLSEVWRADLSPSTRTELGAGVGAYTRTGPRRPKSFRGAPPPDASAVLPIASGVLNHKMRWLRQDTELRLESRLAPHLSSITGDAYYRGDVFGSATLILIDKTRLRARVGGAAELSAAELPERLLLGDLEVQYPVRNDLSVSLGVQALQQQVSASTSAPRFQWGGYVSLVARSDAR